MKRSPAYILLALLMVGCSGEPAPTVGDAEVSKGIARRPMPQPANGRSVGSGITAGDLAKLRERR